MAHTTHPPLVGAHISGAGNLAASFQRARSIGCSTFQIFTKNNRRWFEAPLDASTIAAFHHEQTTSGIQIVIAHASYLINIGSPKQDVAHQSTMALVQELERCEQLGIPILVLHPGSHLGDGEDRGIERITENLNKALATTTQVTVALETMAGQGTNLGYHFEHLARIQKGIERQSHIGFCLDTCHMFAAGYDMSTHEDYQTVMHQVDAILGLKNILCMHLNDSQCALGSRKDRHESLGRGKIPLDLFKWIMQDHRLKNIPKILETPNPELYAQEIELLQHFCINSP